MLTAAQPAPQTPRPENSRTPSGSRPRRRARCRTRRFSSFSSPAPSPSSPPSVSGEIISRMPGAGASSGGASLSPWKRPPSTSAAEVSSAVAVRPTARRVLRPSFFSMVLPPFPYVRDLHYTLRPRGKQAACRPPAQIS